MQTQRSLIRHAGLALGLLMVLGSCADGVPGANSFQGQYAVARQALEDGRYDRAKTAYARLISQAGPLAPRLQLEYAHAALRSGAYEEAAKLAASVAAGQNGQDRAAALAVQGTAQHELALQLVQAGQPGPAKAQLDAAQKALKVVIKDYPDLDPLGAMAGRHASITSLLKRL